MRYRHLVVAGLAVGLAIAAAGCGSEGGNDPADSPTTTSGGATTTEHDMSKMKPGETMPPGY
jgi:hypothetical protein